MPKVSVIIPVYGVENYIERCVRSLFEQTLDDIEYIFVNDCTPDNSFLFIEKLLCEYPNRKDSVVIINHESNKGLPIARLSGLKVAKGDYIIHCDSDDWLEIDAFEKMYKVAKKEKSDMVICDFFTSDGLDRQRMKACYHSNNIQLINDFFSGKGYWCVWNKLVHKSVYYNPITFPKYNVAEDMVLVTQLLYYSRKINYIDTPLYYYYKNPQSMTRIVTEEGIYNKFCQAISNYSIVDTFIKINLTNKIEKDAIAYTKFKQKALLMPLLHISKYYLIWLKTYPELIGQVVFNSYICSKHKLKFYLALVRLYRKRL